MSNFKFLKYGVPLFILVLGAPLGLREFQQLKFDFGRNKTIDRKELKEMGIKVKEIKEVTLETEFEKIEKIDTENWENKRGPRPWEENNELYQEALARSAVLENRNKNS